MENIAQVRRDYYNHVHRQNKGRNEPRWRGVRVVKYPSDLVMYAEAIQQNKPDILIETGTRFGGSAVFFADMLKLFTGGKVISIDVESYDPPQHEGVEYIIGSSTDKSIVSKVKEKVKGKKVMVVLDSDHRRLHVKNELIYYSHIVTKGQYLVVEDCYTYHEKPFYPYYAVEWFLGQTDKYVMDTSFESRFVFGITQGGWLRRVR